MGSPLDVCCEVWTVVCSPGCIQLPVALRVRVANEVSNLKISHSCSPILIIFENERRTWAENLLRENVGNTFDNF